MKFLKEQDEEALKALENVKRALSETIKDEYREEAKENRSIADKGSLEEKVTSVSTVYYNERKKLC